MRARRTYNAVVAALVMASIIRCGGKVHKPGTGAVLVYGRPKGSQ